MFDFLTFGRKITDDPFSNLRTVSHWLKDLPLGDVYLAHEKVVRGLIEFNEQTENYTKEHLQVLMRIDEAAREMQHALCQQYLANPRMSKGMEQGLWNAVFSFYWEVTRGYHAFVMDYVTHPGTSNIKSLIPLITARSLRNFSSVFKWRYFRYEKVDERSWKRLHNLYHFAEFSGFEFKSIVLYEAEDITTTCAQEYLQALMLDTINSGIFYPRQVELVSSWLENWSHMLKPEKQYDSSRHVYCVNYDLGSAARRIRNGAGGPLCRYWGVAELGEHLAQIRTSLHNDMAPVQLGLGEDCRLPACSELFETVAFQWSHDLPRVQRKHQRTKVMRLIEVLHGFHNICAQLEQGKDIAKDDTEPAPMSYAEMVDYKLFGFVTGRTQAMQEDNKNSSVHAPVPHESWVMENESEWGFGATVNEISNDWVQIGKLVCLKSGRTRHSRVGVVRRLNRLLGEQCYVGIELLAEAVVTVMLHPRQAGRSGYSVDGIDTVDAVLPVAAIYLPRDAGGEHGSLVMESAAYAMGRLFELTANGKTYSIRLKEVLEHGADWLRAGFDVISKNQADTASTQDASAAP
jgi:hypothetical protein